MKKLRKILLYILSASIGLVLLGVVTFYAYYGILSRRNFAKAGKTAPTLTEDGLTFSTPINSEMILNKKMNHFNVFTLPGPWETATWHNNIQKLAERTRLGIPVTIATDPRHAFGDIARQEYLAVGIRLTRPAKMSALPSTKKSSRIFCAIVMALTALCVRTGVCWRIKKCSARLFWKRPVGAWRT